MSLADRVLSERLDSKLRTKLIAAIYNSTAPSQRKGGAKKNPHVMQMTDKDEAEMVSLKAKSDEWLLKKAKRLGKGHLADYGKMSQDEIAAVLSEASLADRVLGEGSVTHPDGPVLTTRHIDAAVGHLREAKGSIDDPQAALYHLSRAVYELGGAMTGFNTGLRGSQAAGLRVQELADRMRSLKPR